MFALSGLTALALRAVYEVGSLERALAVPHLGLSRPWLSAWGLALGLVLLGGALAAGAFSPEQVGRAWSALLRAWRPAGDWLAGRLAALGEVLGALWGLVWPSWSESSRRSPREPSSRTGRRRRSGHLRRRAGPAAVGSSSWWACSGS